MTYKTINVAPETYERLILYKHAGMTFDEVITEMMSMMPEEEFYIHVLEEHRKRLKKIKAGEFVETDDIDKALEEVWGALLSKYTIIYGKDFLKDLKKIIKSGDKKIKNKVEQTVEKLKIEPHKKNSSNEWDGYLFCASVFLGAFCVDWGIGICYDANSG